MDRKLTEKEKAICKTNAQKLDVISAILTKKCANCNYPLSGLKENFFSVHADGSICELCHAMESAVLGKPTLRAAHDTWKDEQRKKKEILKNKDI